MAKVTDSKIGKVREVVENYKPILKEQKIWKYEAMVMSRCLGCWGGCPDCINPLPSPPHFENEE